MAIKEIRWSAYIKIFRSCDLNVSSRIDGYLVCDDKTSTSVKKLSFMVAHEKTQQVNWLSLENKIGQYLKETNDV